MRSIISFGKDSLRELEEELGNAYKMGNVRAYRLIQALLYIGNKDYDFSLGYIANLLAVTRKTVYNWLTKFMCGGIKWVRNDPFNFASRGRPSRLNAKQKEELYNMVVEGPEKNGFYSGV